jgi:hypothetical protein
MADGTYETTLSDILWEETWKTKMHYSFVVIFLMCVYVCYLQYVLFRLVEFL